MKETEDLRALRGGIIDYLRRSYIGPSGPDDEVLTDRPDRLYLVGTLYPRGAFAPAVDGDSLGEDDFDDGLDHPIELANAWQPGSAAISFLHDGEALTCEVAAAHYTRLPEGGWQRHGVRETRIPIERGAPSAPVFGDRASVVSVWRPLNDGWLVTVALQNNAVHDDAESPPPTEACLFQVSLACDVVGGQVLPYPAADLLNEDPEEQELRLRYSHKLVYGAGHGCSVEWSDAPTVTHVRTEMMPDSVVLGVSPGSADQPVLSLAYLCDEDMAPSLLGQGLCDFVDGYDRWIADRRAEANGLAGEHRDAATRLLSRLHEASVRMREGIRVLCGNTDHVSGPTDPDALLAFRLANRAMREQILQTRLMKNQAGVRGKDLPARSTPAAEPTWYPFQLAFQLLTIASTADSKHKDRDLVDLIWFPTGGGKTEAYLALAAFEMILRRLRHGVRGGGTAVLTRYTLRLLTAQQFQRAATLVCALERMRGQVERLRRTPEFTIGLWVGGETSPNSYKDAQERLAALLKAQIPENPFQIDFCPWCGTTLTPKRRLADNKAYGFAATKTSFLIFCTHEQCAFRDGLPVMVVDEQIFAEPPTMLIATVDKLARTPWVKESGAVLGRGNVPFNPPGLVIQDELHLLSGPLGTTVALYEAAVLGLIGWEGKRPKIVASTATIRAAGEQVKRLYGAPVALFPPSGLNADDSYFAETDHDSSGRLYVGLMPQAHTSAYATVLTLTALLEAPVAATHHTRLLDAYWTVVAYHNSLRELGRTVTIARDDVKTLLTVRASHEVDARCIARDGVIELTSNVSASQLTGHLARLERTLDQGDAVDVVATTNMFSVGIDISRLGLMLMNGQPKTTSEYIQATSRVGRSLVPGLIVTLLRASKPRDRSHYEGFKGYHTALYKNVEPTSVTPWSTASRDRSLHAALVMLVRHGCGLRGNDEAANFRADDRSVQKAVRVLVDAVERAEPDASEGTKNELNRLVAEWDRRARESAEKGTPLRYNSSDKDHPALLKNFGEQKDGWETMHSMRSVDRQVRVLVLGENR